MNSQTPFLHTVTTALPKEISKDLVALCSSPSSEALIDNLIRFVCGAPSSGQFQEDTEAHWASQQALVRQKLSELSKKRRRDADDQNDNSKRQKMSPPSASSDPPKFTLPSISVTSPIRKKVNIVVHQSSIRFINPTSEALEATIPLSSLRRAFILPTRGKSKPHWTIVLMSNDIPDKAKTPASEANHQIIFGIDATTNTAFSATSHSSTSSSSDEATISLKKGDETLPVLKQFLSHLALPILQPSIEKFKSAIGTGTGRSPGVEANRNAKPGTLWFLPQGILWGESKPCEFWAVEDLANNAEGVRMISATGRVCSVIFTRRSIEEDDEHEEQQLGEETAFGQIDGKEQDGIGQWVKNYRHLFGGKGSSTASQPTKASSSRASPSHTPLPAPKPSGPLTISKMIVDSDDEEDADFELADSDDDGGGRSDTSSNEEDSGDDPEAGDSGNDAEGGSDEEEEDLREENHPLLRPGAMPKM